MGESAYDAQALAELIRALCPQSEVVPLRQPMLLRREAIGTSADVIAAKVAPVLRAAIVNRVVTCVFVHADADATEPHDALLAQDVEADLAFLPVPVHAVVPAWELEAWWFLWPDACSTVVRGWTLSKRWQSKSVGTIVNAKEELRRALRPTAGARTSREYRESDAPAIAKAVRESGRVREPGGRSAAFDRFQVDVASCCTAERRRAGTDRHGG